MPVFTSTRDARCSDCTHFYYYYKGNRKRHKCIKKQQDRTLKDKIICDDFKLREGYWPNPYPHPDN